MVQIQNKTKIYSRALVSALEGQHGAEAKKRIENFKNLVKKGGDLKIVGKILREFKKAWKQKDGKVANVITAKPLTKENKTIVENFLKEKKFLVEEKIEPEVLGGIALILGGDFIIDSTIRNKLTRIWLKLKQ